MHSNQWMLESIKEMEDYAISHNLHGLVEQLGSVLEIYASEAMSKDKADQMMTSPAKK